MNYKKLSLLIGSASVCGALMLASSVAADDQTQPAPQQPAVHMPGQTLSISASGRATLGGTIDSLGTNSLTVKSWGGDWTISISSSTKLLRRYDGSSSLSEFHQGDTVNVNGMADASAAWTIDATKVQDLSIQTRNATFTGTISNVSGSSFDLASKNRGTQHVTVNSDATITIDGQSGVISGLQNSMTVEVSGVWNSTQSTIAASKVTARTPGVRQGTFTGTISNLSGSTFDLTTRNRGTLHVTVNANATIMLNGQAGSLTSLQNGLSVSLAGQWNQSQSTVAANKLMIRPAPSTNSESSGSHPSDEHEGDQGDQHPILPPVTLPGTPSL